MVMVNSGVDVAGSIGGDGGMLEMILDILQHFNLFAGPLELCSINVYLHLKCRICLYKR